jgi:hypothetical protein
MLFTVIAATYELLFAPYTSPHRTINFHFGIARFQQQSEVGKGQCCHTWSWKLLTVQCSTRYSTLIVKNPTGHIYDL